jgi:glycosyltransferase involved in cell wall biosynthesis
MNILFITNMYPSHQFPSDGIFIKEQIDGLFDAHEINYKVIVVNAVRFGKFQYLKYLPVIRKEIKSNKYDLIHIHYGLSGFFLLFFRPTIPIILTLHGTDINKRNDNRLQVILTKMILPRVSSVIVQNDGMKCIVKKYNSNVSVIPCGINFQFFNIFNVSSSNFLSIVFPSSPKRKVKNYPLFVEVIKVLKKDTNLDVRIFTLENLSKEEVKNVFNIADCLLLTSFSEGSPQVVKEALACGLPVVSVDVGDVRSILKPIPYCFTSTERDPHVISNLIISTFNFNRYEIRESFVKNHYGFDSNYLTKRLFQFYQNHLSIPALLK